MDSIIVKVNLNGVIGGVVKHTNRQKHTVLLSPEEGSSMTRMIHHTDRPELECIRTFTVPGNVVTGWTQGDSPFWEEARVWKKMSPVHKVISHVNRFDDGYGVSFEFLGDGEE